MIVPSCADQVTLVFVVVPCTVAWNGKVPPVAEAADDGVTITAVTEPLPLVPLPPKGNEVPVPVLLPGTATVALEITPELLAFYDVDMRCVVEPGEFEIMVGNSSRDADLQKVILKVEK